MKSRSHLPLFEAYKNEFTPDNWLNAAEYATVFENGDLASAIAAILFKFVDPRDPKFTGKAWPFTYQDWMDMLDRMSKEGHKAITEAMDDKGMEYDDKAIKAIVSNAVQALDNKAPMEDLGQESFISIKGSKLVASVRGSMEKAGMENPKSYG